MSRSLSLAVRLDVGAQREIDVHRLLHAAIQHTQPSACRLLHLRCANQVAGLHDYLESIAELVGKLAYLNGNIFGNAVARRQAQFLRVRWLSHIGRNYASMS